MARFRASFGAESAGRLAPAKSDKPKIAEILPFPADSDTYSHPIPNVKGDSVIDEKDAWNSFVQSGSVLDYLQYKSVSYAKRNGEVKEDKDEVQDQGTGAQTAEYR